MRHYVWNQRAVLLFLALLLVVGLVFVGCGGPPNPLTEIEKTLQGVPDFSVILSDMKVEGNFFKTYYHKYEIVLPEKKALPDWVEVPEEFFQQYLPFLGMTILTKKEGKIAGKVGPPGYDYVGDKRYGEWRRDSSGGSFWVFYGQYRLLSDLLHGPVYRSSYNNYYTNNRPYYGPNKEYGTTGTLTKSQRPDFYSRRMSKELTQKSSFSQRVNQRIGRTSTSVRSRSGSVGK
ncbi:MAG: hypothetical protein KKB20_16280 [Proteobacteria bacterium]|nr:hypothetical protein [Pseudomonadota bacterium]